MTNLKNGTSCRFCDTSLPMPYDSPLAVGESITLMAAKQHKDILFLYAYADVDAFTDIETSNYYPKFCPECGKRINMSIRSE